MNNFKVVKNDDGTGWNVVDTRTARPNVGFEGIVVDWAHYKRDALERSNEWNKVNPKLRSSK